MTLAAEEGGSELKPAADDDSAAALGSMLGDTVSVAKEASKAAEEVPDKPTADMDLGEEGNEAVEADGVADAPDDDDDGESDTDASEASEGDDDDDEEEDQSEQSEQPAGTASAPLMTQPASDGAK